MEPPRLLPITEDPSAPSRIFIGDERALADIKIPAGPISLGLVAIEETLSVRFARLFLRLEDRAYDLSMDRLGTRFGTMADRADRAKFPRWMIRYRKASSLDRRAR